MSAIRIPEYRYTPDEFLDPGRTHEWPRTRAGATKARLKLAEWLDVLRRGSSLSLNQILALLDAYRDLFAYRLTDSGTARGHPHLWSASKYPFDRADLARHLAGPYPAQQSNRLVTTWKSCCSLATTYRFTLDLDADPAPENLLKKLCHFPPEMPPDELHYWRTRMLREYASDRPIPPDHWYLEDRARHVKRGLSRLGIEMDNPNECLQQPSPCGGLHVTAFLDRPTHIVQLSTLLNAAGIEFRPSLIELFPSPDRPFRLPFGHIPDSPHDPTAWWRFMLSYLQGDIKKQSAQQMHDHLGRHQVRHHARRERQRASISLKQSASEGPPTGQDVHAAVLPSPTPSSEPPKRPRIPRQEIAAEGEVGRILANGITDYGTRNEVLNTLAEHLIFRRRWSAATATSFLTEWIYDPKYQHRSREIEADVAVGSRHVAAKIGKLCSWYERQYRPCPPNLGGKKVGEARFAEDELWAIRPVLGGLFAQEQVNRSRFMLHLLHDARRWGTPIAGGYKVRLSAREVLSHYPSGSHSRYTAHRSARHRRRGIGGGRRAPPGPQRGEGGGDDLSRPRPGHCHGRSVAHLLGVRGVPDRQGRPGRSEREGSS